MKTKVSAFALMLWCAACSSPGGGGGSSSESNPSPAQTTRNGCSPGIPLGADNLAIAKAFNEYRVRCNPSEDELDVELQKIR
jgi:hypothetical protein